MQENNIISIKKQINGAIELNNDYTLPDYIVDVQKLVSCEAHAVIQNVYRTGDTITFEGEISYSILVICVDNTIKNLIYSEDFTLNSEHCDCEASVFDCRLEGTNARLISPRKVNCRSKLMIITTNNVKENISTVCCANGIPEAETTMEKQTQVCKYLMVSDETLLNQHASRDIELNSAKDEISNIVYCRITIHVTERKISEDKLILRGETVYEILYETVNGNYVKHFDRAPFNDVMDHHAGTSLHMCNVNVTDIRASVRNNSFGEMKIIELDYTYGIRCRCYMENDIEIIKDSYSTEYNVESTFDSISAMRMNSMFSSSLSVNDSCNIEDLGGNNIVEIVDCKATVLTTNIKVDISSGKLTVTGDIRFDIVYNGDDYGYHAVVRPFKYERNFDGENEDVYCERMIDAQAASCVIDGDRVLLNAEVFLNIMIAETVDYSYIQKVEFTPCSSDNRGSVIVYYPNKSDTLWDVAKKFRTTCRDIVNANALTSDSLDGIKVLLLPKKKKRSIYNRII